MVSLEFYGWIIVGIAEWQPEIWELIMHNFWELVLYMYHVKLRFDSMIRVTCFYYLKTLVDRNLNLLSYFMIFGIIQNLFQNFFKAWELAASPFYKTWWWWWWWWWWWIVFVVWLTDERHVTLFPARTIVRDPHHRESLTRSKQDLNLCKTWVQALLNEVV